MFWFTKTSTTGLLHPTCTQRRDVWVESEEKEKRRIERLNIRKAEEKDKWYKNTSIGRKKWAEIKAEETAKANRIRSRNKKKGRGT